MSGSSSGCALGPAETSVGSSNWVGRVFHVGKIQAPMNIKIRICIRSTNSKIVYWFRIKDQAHLGVVTCVCLRQQRRSAWLSSSCWRPVKHIWISVEKLNLWNRLTFEKVAMLTLSREAKVESRETSDPARSYWRSVWEEPSETNSEDLTKGPRVETKPSRASIELAARNLAFATAFFKSSALIPVEDAASLNAFTATFPASATLSGVFPCTNNPKRDASEYGSKTVWTDVPAGSVVERGDVPVDHLTEDPEERWVARTERSALDGLDKPYPIKTVLRGWSLCSEKETRVSPP